MPGQLQIEKMKTKSNLKHRTKNSGYLPPRPLNAHL